MDYCPDRIIPADALSALKYALVSAGLMADKDTLHRYASGVRDLFTLKYIVKPQVAAGCHSVELKF